MDESHTHMGFVAVENEQEWLLRDASDESLESVCEDEGRHPAIVWLGISREVVAQRHLH